MEMPVEMFSSPSQLPKDPILRRQHLEDLMAKIHGSFSFMQVESGSLKLVNFSLCAHLKCPCFIQDSLLDGDGSPKSHSRLRRCPSGSPSPLGNFQHHVT